MTNRATHTPGPWLFDSHGYVWAKDHKGTFPVCEIRGWGHFTGRGHGALALMEDEAIAIQSANGTLLAAAPALLAEVKQLALECEEAANLIAPNFPRAAQLFTAAATRARAVAAEAELECAPLQSEERTE